MFHREQKKDAYKKKREDNPIIEEHNITVVPPTINDLTGQQFGHLKVVKLSHYLEHANGKYYYWETQCVNCMNITYKPFSAIKTTKGCRKCELLPKGQSGLNHLLNKYKQNASNRDRTFELSLDQFRLLTSSNCFYCGKETSSCAKGGRWTKSNIKAKRSTWGDYQYNGIDRKDNSLNYTSDNCVPCCYVCNNSKFDKSFDTYKKYIMSLCFSSNQLICANCCSTNITLISSFTCLNCMSNIVKRNFNENYNSP